MSTDTGYEVNEETGTRERRNEMTRSNSTALVAPPQQPPELYE